MLTSTVFNQDQVILVNMRNLCGEMDEVRKDDLYFRGVINERPVDDISLEIFYKPHTLTLLATCISGLLYLAFTRDESLLEHNIWSGFWCMVFFFMIISVLAFPNGPFTRPHPAFWRMVFGASVLYFIMLVSMLFQRREDVRRLLIWLYPDLHDSGPDTKVYAVNCSEFSIQRLWSGMDTFAICHFFGWVTKALLIRHYGILWTISVMWEITEIAFTHLLPNFAECWWDALILDVLLCNGLGIWMGMTVCRFLEMHDYHWESIKDIHTASGRLQRAVLQFTPSSWTSVQWWHPHSSFSRVVACWMMIVVWQLSELNTFFLTHILYFHPPHILNLLRLVLICLVSAPAIRQYYLYVTDARCKRVGTQCWVFVVITLTETIISVKFGAQIFKKTVIFNVLIWLTVQGYVLFAPVFADKSTTSSTLRLLIVDDLPTPMLGTFICIYLCAFVAQRWDKWKVYEMVETPVMLADRKLAPHATAISADLHLRHVTDTTPATSNASPSVADSS